MAKFLLAPDHWEEALVAVKVAPDPGLAKALTELWKTPTDQPAKRLALLPKILKLASDFKKSKAVVAAGSKAQKTVQDLIDATGALRKQQEQDLREFTRSGACAIDVQFTVSDWDGRSFESADAHATFESPGLPPIVKGGKLSSAGLKINDVVLRPVGTVSLDVYTRSMRIEGSGIPYEFKTGQKLMQFNAVQHVKKHKTKAKSMSEARQKFGLKGSVGVDFKLINAGVEVTQDSEYSRGDETETEWEVETGVPTFKEFKQTK